MFEDVKFMRYYSKLIISNKIEVEYKKDPVLVDSFLENESSEDEVIDLIQVYISDVESKINGDIVLPTSGGYDSRILNYFIKDKDRIRSFTYGISKDQSKSSEVVYAKKISEIYNTKWKQIELKEYNKYMDKWADIYGFSTHLHGMYHIEFYTEICKNHNILKPSLLSGVIGDAWAEEDKIENIEDHKELVKLGYTHGMSLDLKFLNLKSDNKFKKEYFKKISRLLKEDAIKTVFAMRTKLILISYLTQIPEYFGMPVWTPFLNFKIVKAILNISGNRRKNRVWQKDFFAKVGLNLEDMDLKSVKSNKLDYEIAKNAKLEKIDIDVMKKYICKKRLIEINKILSKISFYEKIKNQLLYIPKVSGILRRLGFKNKYLEVLNNYYIIKSIEKSLKYVN